MTAPTFLEQMRLNVSASRQHIALQEEIIAQLKKTRHADLADSSKDVLTALNMLLDAELLILARLEAEEGKGSVVG